MTDEKPCLLLDALHYNSGDPLTVQELIYFLCKGARVTPRMVSHVDTWLERLNRGGMSGQMTNVSCGEVKVRDKLDQLHYHMADSIIGQKFVRSA